ncbi:MAG: DNA repair protein RecO [Treponema sp.]|nr:DNA repair protein RecO [Treponema sp.]
MSRNFVTRGIVLTIKRLGENNSSVCFLTEEAGLIYATLYGGAKSKLRSLVSLWNSGTLYLYCKDFPDLTKNVKISDFDVKKYHLSFRENIYKMYAASLAAEIVIKTKAASSSEKCFYLLTSFFEGLEKVDEDECELGLIRFLWRYIGLLGIQCSTQYCCICAKDIITSNSGLDKVSYNVEESGFCCLHCSRPGTFVLRLEAIRYLHAISTLEPFKVRQMNISKEAISEIKKLVLFLLEEVAGTKFKTLQTGLGIL